MSFNSPQPTASAAGAAFDLTADVGMGQESVPDGPLAKPPQSLGIRPIHRNDIPEPDHRPLEQGERRAVDVLASLKSQRPRAPRGPGPKAIGGVLLLALGMAGWWRATDPTAPEQSTRAERTVPAARPVDSAVPALPQAPAVSPTIMVSPAHSDVPPTQGDQVISPSAAEEALRTRIESWRQAWSARDVDTYLAHYSTGFKPAKEPSREAWASSRRRVISSRSDIQLTLSQMRFQRTDDQHWNVEFLQDYASGGYVEKQLAKSLTWALEDGQWVIVSERQQR